MRQPKKFLRSWLPVQPQTPHHLAHLNWHPEPSERSALFTELAADVLRRAGHLRMRVRGESMLPALWPGDIVEIASCSLPEVKLGEIVLAHRDRRFFLHRLVASDRDAGFLLCGDSMAGHDPLFSAEALLGRLVCVVNARRSFAGATLRPDWRGKVSRLLGRLLCQWGMARRLALRLHAAKSPSLELCDGGYFGRTDLGATADAAEIGA